MNDQPIPDAAPRPRRNAGQLVLTLFLLAAAGVGSWQAAIRIAAQIETRSDSATACHSCGVSQSILVFFPCQFRILKPFPAKMASDASSLKAAKKSRSA